MVTQINGLAAGSAGFKLTGEITKADYDNIILPAVKKVTETSPTLNLMLVIDTDLSNFTAGAWMKDAALGLKNLAKFHRVALVSDSEVVKGITSMADKFMPGEYETFSSSQEETAKEWLTGM